MITKIKKRWEDYKETRFLKKHGCQTRKEYERRYDADISLGGQYVDTFYRGYDYQCPINPQGYRDYGFPGVLPYHDLVSEMVTWCDQNCNGKWRSDWMRGFYNQRGRFELCGISGMDLIFFAFKEESDYVWFTLRWS